MSKSISPARVSTDKLARRPHGDTALADADLPSRNEQIACQFTALFEDAIGGVRKMVVFGAAMHQLPAMLGIEFEERPNRHTPKEKTLKWWVEQYCPTVNYNGAYAMLRIARGICASLKIPAGVDVHRALTHSVDELTVEEAKVRELIDGSISGKSAAHLERFLGIRKDPKLLGNGMAGNQNAKKNLDDPERQMANAKLRVEMEVSEAVAALGRLVDNKSIAFMGLKGMRVLAEELERMAEATRKCLKQTAEEKQN